MKTKVFNSSDTNVKKYVFEWPESKTIKAAIAEAVLYRYGSYKTRTVICCSMASGCQCGCQFCGTGKFFQRNLFVGEIVAQIDHIIQDSVLPDVKTEDIERFQIMFMSMGEPMLNYEELIRAIRILA